MRVLDESTLKCPTCVQDQFGVCRVGQNPATCCGQSSSGERSLYLIEDRRRLEWDSGANFRRTLVPKQNNR
jgi:hypothetical protein